MNKDKKEKAARYIENKLCIEALVVAYEVRCMLDDCEKAVINRVLEIIDNDKGGYGACLRIRKEVEALKGDE